MRFTPEARLECLNTSFTNGSKLVCGTIELPNKPRLSATLIRSIPSEIEVLRRLFRMRVMHGVSSEMVFDVGIDGHLSRVRKLLNKGFRTKDTDCGLEEYLSIFDEYVEHFLPEVKDYKKGQTS